MNTVIETGVLCLEKSRFIHFVRWKENRNLLLGISSKNIWSKVFMLNIFVVFFISLIDLLSKNNFFLVFVVNPARNSFFFYGNRSRKNKNICFVCWSKLVNRLISQMQWTIEFVFFLSNFLLNMISFYQQHSSSWTQGYLLNEFDYAQKSFNRKRSKCDWIRKYIKYKHLFLLFDTKKKSKILLKTK